MIFLQLEQQLQSLNDLLLALSDEQYSKQIEHLGNASIGGHSRHIIELLECLLNGYNTNEVDYLNRKRNLQLEKDRSLALSHLLSCRDAIRLQDKNLQFITEESAKASQVTTTYFREIVYNTEHIIHHLALIKVALIEMQIEIVDAHFGMAYSTIKYKAALTN